MKKLLIDGGSSPVKFKLNESSSGLVTVVGEFGYAGKPTENKRIYGKQLWEREIKKILPSMKAGKVLSESDHPESGKTSLKRVSAVMKNISIEPDGRIIGEATICDNEHGRQLLSIIKAGGAVGVSSRGMGSVIQNEDGFDVVGEDFEYITHDFVADPAVKSSYPEFNMESKELNKNIVQEVEEASEGESMKKKKIAEETATVEIEASGKVEVEKEGNVQVLIKPEETKDEAPVEVPVPELTPEPAVEEPAAESTVTEAADMSEFAKELADKKFDENEIKIGELVAQGLSNEEIANQLFMKEGEVKKMLPEMYKKLGVESRAQFIVWSLKHAGEEIKAKYPQYTQEKIEALESKLAEANKKCKELEEGSQKVAAVAKKMGMALKLESYASEHKHGKKLKEMVGNPSKYADEKALDEAIKTADKKLRLRIVAEEKTKKQISEAVEAKEREIREMKLELAKAKNQVDEALEMTKKFGLMVYVEHKVRGNPNADKIRELCESTNVKDKKAVDLLVQKFSVAGNLNEDYNNVRRSLENRVIPNKTRLVESKVVEKQVAETRAEKKKIYEGVDAEIADVTMGGTLDDVMKLV